MPDLRELYQEVFDPAWHPGSCRMRPGSNLALTWITAQHKPRHRSIEKESDRPHLSQKTLDPSAGLETYAHTVTKSWRRGSHPPKLLGVLV